VKKKDALGGRLETAVNDLLDTVKGKDVDAELKLKVLDRAMKYWAIKNKIPDQNLGAGFKDDDDKGDE
jgi:hypothetical protein